MKILTFFIALFILSSTTLLAQVGIGVEDPDATLDVFGTFKFTDGSHGANKVLTSDAEGFASWQEPELTELANGTSLVECFSSEGMVNTGNQPWSVAVSGDYAYVVNVNSNTLQLFDISNPGAPNLAGTATTGNQPYSVAVSGNYAYVVNYSDNSLQIFNVGTPSSPTLAGSVSTDSEPSSVAVSGNTAYVVNGSGNTLQIFNVSNPGSPSLMGSVPTDSFPRSVAVSGSYAYVANWSSGTLQIFNVSNPSIPVLTGSISTDSGTRAVAVSGNYAYVINPVFSTLRIVNIINPSIPSLEGSLATGAYPVSVAVSGNYVYVVNANGNSLQIFDVSAPSNPSLRGILATDSEPNSVDVSGNHAFVVNSGSNTLQAFQVKCDQYAVVMQNGEAVLTAPAWMFSDSAIYSANPGKVGIGVENPAAKLDVFGTFKFTDGSHGANKVLTSDATGFASWQLPELTDLANGTAIAECLSFTGNASTDSVPSSVAVSGNYAYVVNDYSSTLKVFNISNPSTPYLVGSAATGNIPRSVAFSGNYAYVVNYGSSNLQIFNVSNPASPILAGAVATGVNPSSVAVSGNYAYVVNYSSFSLQIFNVTNPASPSLTGVATTGSDPISIAVSGNYAYVVNNGSSTLQIFNVSNPAGPILAGWVATGSTPQSIAVSGGYAYVASPGSGGIQIFNVNNPANPSLVSTYGTGEDSWPSSVAVSGNYAYVTNQSYVNTLQIIDISNPSGPVAAASAETGILPHFVAVQGNYAYLVCQDIDQLQVFQISCPQSSVILEDGNLVAATATWQTSNNDISNSNSGNVGIGTNFPTAKLDVAGGNIRTNQQLVSTVSTGTAPLSVTSTTQVPNLNADLLDGLHATSFASASGSANYIQNQTAANQSAGFRINGNGIFSSGKLGVGITNPTGDLHFDKSQDILLILAADNNNIGEDDNPRIELSQDAKLTTGALGMIGNGGAIYSGSLLNALYLMNEAQYALHIGTDSIIRITIREDGKVGINATDPLEILDVNGNARFRTITSGTYFAPLNVTSTGVLTTATSDLRMKTNIEPLGACLDKVMQLRGVRYNWKDDPNGFKKIGFIAQEVEPLFPEIVFTNPNDGFKGINYAEMTSVLVEAMQELRAEKDDQISTLNAQNEALIKIIENLQARVEVIEEAMGGEKLTDK